MDAPVAAGGGAPLWGRGAERRGRRHGRRRPTLFNEEALCRPRHSTLGLG